MKSKNSIENVSFTEAQYHESYGVLYSAYLNTIEWNLNEILNKYKKNDIIPTEQMFAQGG